MQAQSSFFENLDHPPTSISTAHLLAHSIRSIGFRYYWATESLRVEDLNYRPSTNARSSRQTLEHLYGLASMIHSSIHGASFVRSQMQQNWSFEQLREKTLMQLEEAYSTANRLQPTEIEELQIRFSNQSNDISFPIWNLIQGPIADAQYHIGQVVSFRRTSGNPVDAGVNVFRGSHAEND